MSRLRAAWRCLCIAAGLLVPRFITDDVAMRYVGGPTDDFDSYEIVCHMKDVRLGERFSAVASVESFVWLNFGVSLRIGNFRPWPSAIQSGRQA